VQIPLEVVATGLGESIIPRRESLLFKVTPLLGGAVRLGLFSVLLTVQVARQLSDC
jgi:hypothetical protein